MALVGTAICDSVSTQHTLAAGNGNRIVVAGYFVNNEPLDATPTGVTYGGQEMTHAVSDVLTGTDPLCVYFFYLLEANLPANGANSLDFTALDNSTGGQGMWVACFDDLAQAAPTFAGSAIPSGNNCIIDITIDTTNDTAVYFAGHRSRETFSSTTLDAYLFLDINSGGNSIVGGYALTEPAGTYTANWVSTTSAPGRVLGMAFAQEAATAGTSTILQQHG